MIQAVASSAHVDQDSLRFLLEDLQFETIVNISGKRFLRKTDRTEKQIGDFAKMCAEVQENRLVYFSSSEVKEITVVGPQESVGSVDLVSREQLIAGPNLLYVPSTKNAPKIYSYINDDTLNKKFAEVVGVMNSGVNITVKSARPKYRLIKTWDCSLPFPRVRVLHDMDKLLAFNCYGPMALQGILHDLLRSGYNRINVRGFDLYASERPAYGPEYSNIPSRLATGNSLIFHEPGSNFLFVKNLWQLGLLVPDPNLSEVLSLTTLEYLEKLDELYR